MLGSGSGSDVFHFWCSGEFHCLTISECFVLGTDKFGLGLGMDDTVCC